MGKYNPKFDLISKKTTGVVMKFENSPTNKQR